MNIRDAGHETRAISDFAIARPAIGRELEWLRRAEPEAYSRVLDACEIAEQGRMLGKGSVIIRSAPLPPVGCFYGALAQFVWERAGALEAGARAIFGQRHSSIEAWLLSCHDIEKKEMGEPLFSDNPRLQLLITYMRSFVEQHPPLGSSEGQEVS